MALNEHGMSSRDRDARVDQLYAHMGREAPPAELDAAIRAAARQAVGARPRALGARLRRWGVPVSIAAVVVVSVSLVTLMREQGAGRLDESYSPAPAEPKAAAPAEPVRAQEKARDRVEPGRAEVASPQAPAAPAERAGAASSADAQLRAPGLAEPAGARLEPAEEAGSGRALGEADRAATRQAAPGAEVMGKKKTEAGAADAPAAPPAAAIRSAPARIDQESLAAPERETSERSLADDRLKSLMKGLENEAPEAWLEKIERLRREGQRADADALLLEFKRRFPQHPASGQKTERSR